MCLRCDTAIITHALTTAWADGTLRDFMHILREEAYMEGHRDGSAQCEKPSHTALTPEHPVTQENGHE
jgi:hypothetical protein